MLKEVSYAFGYQQITSLSSATGLTVPTLTKGGQKVQPTLAVIFAEAQALRWRDDGTDPTATVGMPLAVGLPFEYDGDLHAIRFIEQTSGGIVNISYYA